MACEADAPYRAARSALARVELSSGGERAAAWRACEGAWEAAVSFGAAPASSAGAARAAAAPSAGPVAAYKLAQEALSRVEASSGGERSMAWEACEAAWSAAMSVGEEGDERQPPAAAAPAPAKQGGAAAPSAAEQAEPAGTPAKDEAPLEDISLEEEEPAKVRPSPSGMKASPCSPAPEAAPGARPPSLGQESKPSPAPKRALSPRTPLSPRSRRAPAEQPEQATPLREPARGSGSSSQASPPPGAASALSPKAPRDPESAKKAGASSSSPSKTGVRRSLKSLSEVDSQIVNKLERFFGDETLSRDLEGVVSSSTSMASSMHVLEQQYPRVRPFRVRVPKPYPGVQYRRSKNLEDRYQRFVQNGSVVAGQVEDNGEWLRISGDIFIPMKVGSVVIVEPMIEESGINGTGTCGQECGSQLQQCAVQ